jgi:hypothetical protein
MPAKPTRCEGSGKPSCNTYTTPVRGSGGIVRPQTRGTCPDKPEHRGLPLHDGNVQSHGK